MNELINEIELEDIPPNLQVLAKKIGIKNLIFLAEEMGGLTIYVPKKENFFVGAKNRRIIKEFNGYNQQELAKKYNVSERWIRKLTNKDYEEKNQLNMLDYLGHTENL